MAREHLIRRYRRWYARLLRLHAPSHHERFGEAMEQTFSDLLRDRAADGRRLFGCALWVFSETTTGIIRERTTLLTMQNRAIIRILLATALILSVPFIAMQFTDEVAWGPGDFVVAGVLLIGTGLMYELVARKAGVFAHRIAAGLAVAGGLLLIWINLAVGIIGSESNPANLMFAGVLAVGLVGALIAHFRPPGMARALFATALAQALVAAITLAAGLVSGVGVAQTIFLNGFFVVVWVVSAVLFRTERVAVAGV